MYPTQHNNKGKNKTKQPHSHQKEEGVKERLNAILSFLLFLFLFHSLLHLPLFSPSLFVFLRWGLTVQLRLSLNSGSSCFYLLSAGINKCESSHPLVSL
jgi:hypothetical protein